MAPSADEEAAASLPHISDKDLKPFYVLHKASNTQQQHLRKAFGRSSRKVKVNLSSSLAATDHSQLLDDPLHNHSRIKNFHHAWLKIDSTIKDVLHNINADVFNDIYSWVRNSFGTVCSGGKLEIKKATCSYPVLADVVTSNHIFTALVVTSNIEFVDDLQTFADLGGHLHSHGCHVANLSSVDFSAKSGIGGCLRSLLRQILNGSTDAADISVLASWYMEHDNFKNPVVVIIEDMDRCSGSVLSDFILMLSEWVIKIPVILILGVATTLDAPKSVLSSKAVQHLSPSKFFLGHPADRLDAIIEAVLVKRCSGFLVGHKVAAFIRNCFLRQDGTLTSLIRAVKMAIVQHFLLEPLSFTVSGLLNAEVTETDEWPRQALDLPSCLRLSEPKSEALLSGASKMKDVLNLWSSIVLCLHEAGKSQRITLLDLYDEALDPKLYNLRNSDYLELKPDSHRPSWNHGIHGQSFETQKGRLIGRMIRQIRDLPPAALFQLLEKWDKQTKGTDKIHEKVKELQLQENFENDNLKGTPTRSRKQTIRNNGNLDKGKNALNEKAAALITCMTRDHMQPIECIPFHEIVCFKNVDKLQAALLGDPRKRIQLDLLECNKFLKCSCCTKSHNVPISSMHDTALMYTLSQEHGNLINLHDWYQSFKAVISQKTVKDKQHKSKVSPSPKKRKITAEPQNITEAFAQARFCRAVTELQIAGLLRMPSKRRQDYVQRVAFGL